MNLFPKRRAPQKPSSFFRPRLENLEDRNVMTADLEGDTVTSAMALNLGLGALYKHSATIGDGDYPNKDVDLYSISLTSGQRLTTGVVAIAPEEGGYSSLSAMDTYLRIFDSSGIQVAFNDDGTNPFTGSSTTDSYIKFVAPSSGTFYIGVSGYGNNSYNPSIAGSASYGETGAYRLELVKADVAAPSAPTTLNGSLSSTGTVNLSWSAYQNATGYSLERRNASSPANQWALLASLDATQTTYSDSPPNANTKYEYRLQNVTLGGPSAYSSNAAVTTALAAPTSVSASLISGNQIDLAWTNPTSSMSNVLIEKSLSSSSGFSKVATISGNATSYSASGPFQTSSTYYFRIRYFLYDEDAPEGGYYSSYSSTASATVPGYPDQPSNFTARSISTSEVLLTWSDTANETSYKVEKLVGGNWSTVTTLAANQTDYVDAGLNANTSYSYRVTAINASGSSTPSATASATTSAPLQSGPATTIVSGSRADLTWSTRLDDEYGTAIEQSLNGTNGWTQIGSVASGVTTFTSTGSYLGSTTYYFRTRSGAYSFGTSTLSAYSLVTNTTSSSFPNAATGPAAVATSHSTISLSWTDTANETNYRIERQATSSGSVWTLAGTVSQNTTSFVDTGLSENQTYTYRVFATNGWGDSAPTSNIEAKTLLAAPTNVVATSFSGSQIDLSWSDNSQSEESFLIEQSPTGTGNWTQVASAGADETQFSVTGSFSRSTAYYFRVRAYANAGGSGPSYSKYSDIASVTTPAYPDQPTNFTATTISTSEISLQWSDTANETGYRIEEQFDGSWSYRTTLGANVASYQVTGLFPGTAHTYRVVALNASGSSVPSLSASATTMPRIPVFAVTITSGTQIDINWVTQPDDSIETRIEGSVDGVNNWLPIGSVSSEETTCTSPYLRFSGSTKYYFRLAFYQYSSLYTSYYSPVVDATSLAFPAIVSGITGTATSHSTISLNWADASDETSYRIERWLTSWTVAGTVGPNTTSFVDTGLSENQVYHYQIIAINGVGESAPASSSEIRTLFATPTGVVASSISSTQIDLSWVDNSQFEWAYLIEQSPTGTGNWTQVASVEEGQTQFSVTGSFEALTTYYFRIRANGSVLGYGPNGYGYFQHYSKYSDVSSITTPSYAYQPKNFVATPLSDTQVKLTWNDTANESSYRIERQVNSVWTTLATIAANATEYTHTGLTELTFNSYRIIAINSVGQSVPSTTATIVTPPKAPANLSASAISGSRIDLSWSDLSNAETYYEIEQSPDGSTNWTNIGSVNSNTTSFSAAGPFDGSTTYFFRVRAKVYDYYYPQGMVTAFSNYSPVCSTTTPAFPNQPKNLLVTPTSHSTLKLEWDDLPNETGYRVEKLNQSVWPAVWVPFANLTAGTTQYTATGLSEGSSYQFRIFANNALGESQPSLIGTARTLLATPTQLAAIVYSGSRIDLSWVDNSAIEQNYYVEMATLANNDWRHVGWLPANSTHFTATGPFNGSTDYMFRVKAYHPGYNLGYVTQYLPNSSLYSDLLQVQTPAFPNVPSGLQAVATTATSVSLSWTDLSNETMYRIERSDTANPFDWSLIDEVPANTTTYTDPSCWEGRPFYYRVVASNSLGNSAPSSTLVATTKLGTPTNLTATPFSGAKMALTWVDHSFNENGFTIEQSLNGTTGWVSVGWAAANANHFDAPGPFLGSTPYYFRVKAIKQGPDIYPTLWNESAYSSIAQTTTPAFPNPPTGLTSTLVTDTSVTLSWTDLPNETDYMIERQVGNLWAAIDTVPANVTTYTDTNLEERRSYVYRVTATNLLGQSAASQPISVFTHLATPTGLAAQVLSGGRIDLSWNDRSIYEQYYIVEQSLDGSVWKSIGSTFSTSNSFTASGPFDGSTVYRFRVRGHKYSTINSPEDQSANSNVVTLTTPAFPNQPTGLAITNVSATSLALSWNNLSNETGFRVERSSAGVPVTWTPLQTVSANTTTFVDSNVTEGTFYSYRIVAVNESGESAPSPLQQVKTKPGAPSGLTATVVSGGQINLSWTDTSQSENGFVIEMLTDGVAGWRFISSVGANQTTYSATGPFVGGKSYSFRITTTTLDLGLNPGYLYSAPSNVATVTTPAFPSQPNDLVVTGMSESDLKLTWADLSGETQYRLERLVAGEWNLVETVPANTTSFIVSGLTENTLRTYRVVAINALGESAPSAEASGRSLLAAPGNLAAVAVSGSQVDLTWTDRSVYESQYDVEMSTNGATDWRPVSFLLAANSNAFTVNGNFNGATPYYFRVRASNRGDWYTSFNPLSSLNSQITGFVTPAYPNQPAGLTLEPQSGSTIKISWTDLSNETSYRIERFADSQWSLAGTVTQNSTTFIDTALAEAKTYSYRVFALNAAGDSAPSLTLSKKTLLATPTNLSATYSSGKITLNWTDHSTAETQYEVEQLTGTNNRWSPVGVTSGPGITTFVFPGIVDGNTTYTFRVRAAYIDYFTLNYNFSQYSGNAEITTPVIPAKPTGLVGEANSDTSITLNWADLSNETGYRIECQTSNQWVSLATVAANTTTYIDQSGLTEGMAASYRVIATGANGDSPPSSLVSLQTKLKAPTGLSGSVVSGSRIDLSWTDQSTKETAYIIEQSPNGTDQWVQSGKVGANVTQFSAPGPFIGQTTYHFRIRASFIQIGSGSNWSLYSSNASVVTPAFTAAPSNIIITSQSENAISLTWSDLADETEYKIERLIDGLWSLAGTTAAGVTTFTDTNLTEATAYAYQISGSNSLGVGTPSITVQAKTKLSKPTNVVAIVASPSQATITWVDHSSSESNFTIEKSLNGVSDWSYVGMATASTTSVIATGPFAGSTTYYFRVRANSSANGSSDWSLTASATTPAFPTQPKGFTGIANSDTSISLSWADLPNESGYRVEKLINNVWTSLQTLNADVVSYTQTGLTEGSDHTYRVVAIANGIDSLPSNQLNLWTKLKSPINLAAQPVSGSRIDLSWVDLSDRETGYVIEQSIAGSNTWSVSGTVGQNIPSFQAPGPFLGATTYLFRVHAISYNSSSLDSDTVTLTTPAFPNAPTGLSVKSLTDTTISLAWSLASNITSYRIERQDLLNGSLGIWTPVQSLSSAQNYFVDSGLVEGTTYFYRVIASNTIADSAPSMPLSATTAPGTPTGLTAAVVSGGQIDLSWQDNSRSEWYFTVEQQVGSSNNWAIAANSTTTSVTLNGPFNGNTYYRFRVRAFMLMGGFSLYSETFSLTTPGFPNQPIGIAATTLSTSEISFTWNSTADTDQYILQRSIDASPGTWTQVGIVGGTFNSFTLGGLTEGSRGYFRLIAINSQGRSAPSRVLIASTNLQQPTNLTATPISGGRIHLSWENLSTVQTGFAIDQSVDGISWSPVNNLRATTTEFDASGPFNGATQYYFRVKAVNDVLGTSSPFSPISSVLTPAYPNQPGTLSAVSLGPTEIKLTWQEVASAKSYTIQRSNNGQSSWSTIYSVQSGTSTFTDLSLNEFSTYFYRIIATNDSGDSAPSLVASTQTMFWSPGLLNASSTSGSTLDLSWVNRSNFAGYNSIIFEISTNNSTWYPLKTVSGATTSTSILVQLNGSTRYYIRSVIATLLSYRNSQYSTTEITTPSYPNKPSANIINVLTPTSAQLSWIDLPDETGYLIERKIDGSTAWYEAGTAEANVTSYIDVNLQPSTKYFYRVSAINATGRSAYSNEVTAVLPPDKIKNASATLITEDRLDLNWSRPEKPVAIKVEASQSSTGPWSVVGVSNPNSTYFSIPGPFSSLTSYFFRLTAYNATGSSEPIFVSFTTPTLLSTPDSPWVESISSSSVQLSWEATPQASQYQIFRRIASSDWINIGLVGNSTLAFTDSSNLTSGTLYQYGIAAEFGGKLSGIVKTGLVLPGDGDEDADGDQISNNLEANVGTNPLDADTDNDTFPDGWEFDTGAFDPTQFDDPQADADEDGLSNWDEFLFGTDPEDEDSDQDGYSDVDELDEGTDPSNSTDNGELMASDMIAFFDVKVGDPSGSQSEKYMLEVGDQRIVNTAYGKIDSRTLSLRAGRSYNLHLTHLGSLLPTPDYDWITEFGQSDADIKLPYFITGQDKDYFKLNSDVHPFKANNSATLHIPLLDADVDSDNTNEYDLPDLSMKEDVDEEGEENVKIVYPNSGDIDTDGTPDYADNKIIGGHFVPLVVTLSGNVFDVGRPSVRLTFKFNSAGASQILPAAGDGGFGPSLYTYTPGAIRIWTKNAYELRNENTDLIVSGKSFQAFQYSGSKTELRWVFYIEGMDSSDDVRYIEVHADIAGDVADLDLYDTVNVAVPKNASVIIIKNLPDEDPVQSFNHTISPGVWSQYLADRKADLAAARNPNLPQNLTNLQALGSLTEALDNAELLARQIKDGIDIVKRLDNSLITSETSLMEDFLIVTKHYNKYLQSYIQCNRIRGKYTNITDAFGWNQDIYDRIDKLPVSFDGLNIEPTSKQLYDIRSSISDPVTLARLPRFFQSEYATGRSDSILANAIVAGAIGGGIMVAVATWPVSAPLWLTVAGLGMLAGSAVTPAITRYQNDQPLTQIGLGVVADVVGYSDYRMGVTGIDPRTGKPAKKKDPITGEMTDLSEYDLGKANADGAFSLALSITGFFKSGVPPIQKLIEIGTAPAPILAASGIPVHKYLQVAALSNLGNEAAVQMAGRPTVFSGENIRTLATSFGNAGLQASALTGAVRFSIGAKEFVVYMAAQSNPSAAAPTQQAPPTYSFDFLKYPEYKKGNPETGAPDPVNGEDGLYVTKAAIEYHSKLNANGQFNPSDIEKLEGLVKTAQALVQSGYKQVTVLGEGIFLTGFKNNGKRREKHLLDGEIMINKGKDGQFLGIKFEEKTPLGSPKTADKKWAPIQNNLKDGTKNIGDLIINLLTLDATSADFNKGFGLAFSEENIAKRMSANIRNFPYKDQKFLPTSGKLIAIIRNTSGAIEIIERNWP